MKKLPERQQIGWQVFRRLGDDFDYFPTKRGCYAHLVRLEALCAKCGKPFEAKATKRNWRSKQLARRCERHRKPGARVNNDKPPVLIAKMPTWAQPVTKLIKSTAAKKRYSTAKKLPSIAPVSVRPAPRCESVTPDLSYLD